MSNFYLNACVLKQYAIYNRYTVLKKVLKNRLHILLYLYKISFVSTELNKGDWNKA